MTDCVCEFVCVIERGLRVCVIVCVTVYVRLYMYGCV